MHCIFSPPHKALPYNSGRTLLPFRSKTDRWTNVEISLKTTRYDPQQHEGTNDDNEGAESKWKSSIEHAVFGNAKRHLSHPPKSMAEDGTFVQVADLPDLYRVFERC